MSTIWLYAVISTLIIGSLSMIGVITLSMQADRLKKILLLLVSFSAGALLADTFIHLLPEAVEKSGFGLPVSLSILGGIALLFVLEKIIHWHHCHHVDNTHPHPFVFMNLLGDAVHNFIDGLIIGVSYLVSIPVGIATTIAVILHEIPQEIGDFGILLHGGLSKKKALVLNALSAFMAVIGTIIALAIGTTAENFVDILIPFAAGSFIYIAGSDLIPELHKEMEAKKSFVQFLAFVCGIGVMMLLLLLE